LDRLAIGFTTSRLGCSPLYGCVGAVSGIAIKIVKPQDVTNPASYFCRNGFYSIPVQAVVDSSYCFTYLSAVYVGSTHDSTAWSVSKVGIQLKATGMKSSYWLAGDAAYDCRNGLLTPWSQSQVNDPTCGLERGSFNYYHSSSRMHVEQSFGIYQSFGILMARFGTSWRPLRFHLRKVPVILHPCMVLHTYCLDNNIAWLETTMSPQEEQGLRRPSRPSGVLARKVLKTLYRVGGGT
jgi:DDE superfamily endonuclease